MQFVFRRRIYRIRRRGFFFGFASPSTLAPSGIGTATFVGTAITPATFSSSGVAALAGVGTAVTPASLVAAGVAAVGAIGTGLVPASLAAAGAALFNAIKPLDVITSRRILHDPVDCVLAGQQNAPVKPGRIGGRFLRKVFGE